MMKYLNYKLIFYLALLFLFINIFYVYNHYSIKKSQLYTLEQIERKIDQHFDIKKELINYDKLYFDNVMLYLPGFPGRGFIKYYYVDKKNIRLKVEITIYNDKQKAKEILLRKIRESNNYYRSVNNIDTLQPSENIIYNTECSNVKYNVGDLCNYWRLGFSNRILFSKKQYLIFMESGKSKHASENKKDASFIKKLDELSFTYASEIEDILK